MPPKIDLSSLKDEILQMHCAGYNYNDIALQISNLGRTVSQSTIKRYLAIWNIRKRAFLVGCEDGMLRSYIAIYFIGNLLDNKIAFVLGQQG